MNNFRCSGAGTPLTFLNTVDENMDLDLGQSSYLDEYQQRDLYNDQGLYREYSTAYTGDSVDAWPADHSDFQQASRAHHLSISSDGSGLSGYRSSGSSFFSDCQNRFSSVSSISTWSNQSTQSSQLTVSGEHGFYPTPPTSATHDTGPMEGLNLQAVKRRTTPRVTTQEKDYYKTCVSRTRQKSRRSTTAQKYFCTACGEPFVEKADWKRHEEEYQERAEKYECDNCYAIYFLDKNFVTHHKNHHGCVPCSQIGKHSEKRHVQTAKKLRKARTGWGCGFCYHFSDNWTERCKHVAHHFDQEHKTMADWKHSYVIYSLLQRPAVLVEWQAILEGKQRIFTAFDWDPKSTGRVEGYPESNQTLQLQDALEYFDPTQGSAAVVLAQWAYDLATKKISRHRPPPVQRKDYFADHHKASLQDIMKETESWTQFIKSVIEDDKLPTGTTTLENDSLDDVGASSSWLDTSH